MEKGIFIVQQLPNNVVESMNKLAIKLNPANEPVLEGVGDTERYWPIGYMLRIAFLDGNIKLHDIVKHSAMEWCKYANLRFRFDSNLEQSDIRISFQPTGYWSYIGLESKHPSLYGKPTMNFDPQGFADRNWIRGTILHEFGHALGLLHEHQSPASNIQWNEKAVIQDIPHWTYQDIKDNILTRYSTGMHTQFTQFDPSSIMIYPIPKHWTLNGFSVNLNLNLSSTDKAFVQAIYS